MSDWVELLKIADFQLLVIFLVLKITDFQLLVIFLEILFRYVAAASPTPTPLLFGPKGCPITLFYAEIMQWGNSNLPIFLPLDYYRGKKIQLFLRYILNVIKWYCVIIFSCKRFVL